MFDAAIEVMVYAVGDGLTAMEYVGHLVLPLHGKADDDD